MAMQDEAIRSRYVAAEREVGIRFVSQAMRTRKPSGNPRKDFLADHEHFMTEMNEEVRSRTIGGAPLDIFSLYKNVLKRGGVYAVTMKRSFKDVARALNLPRSCTSAATVLRMSYMAQLYLYEQMHVLNRASTRDEIQLPLSGRTPISAPHAVHFRVGGAAPGPDTTPAIRGVVATTPAHALANRDAGTAPGRPKRHAASMTAAGSAELTHPEAPLKFVRRGRPGIDEANLTGRERAIVRDHFAAPRHAFPTSNPQTQPDRDRLVASLKCPVHGEIAWALGTLNMLSFDSRNLFHAQMYVGLLSALHNLLAHYMEDFARDRPYGGMRGLDLLDMNVPRNAFISELTVVEGGDGMGSDAASMQLTRNTNMYTRFCGRTTGIQLNEEIFNHVDPHTLDRRQHATVVVNILRNMSMSESNALLLVNDVALLTLTADMQMNFSVPWHMRDALMDTWVNIAPYLNCSALCAGSIVLRTCTRLLDPFLEGADYSRFASAAEILARLAASPERNEEAIVAAFPDLLPRLIDMVGGRDRQHVNAALAALCNCSAFEWPARGQMARVQRAIPRLIAMLHDAELAPRASLTLLNLAEAPSNRNVLLAYESSLVGNAIESTPAADTLAYVLYGLSGWD